jgi:hypothetical protein
MRLGAVNVWHCSAFFSSPTQDIETRQLDFSLKMTTIMSAGRLYYGRYNLGFFMNDIGYG